MAAGCHSGASLLLGSVLGENAVHISLQLLYCTPPTPTARGGEGGGGRGEKRSEQEKFDGNYSAVSLRNVHAGDVRGGGCMNCTLEELELTSVVPGSTGE